MPVKKEDFYFSKAKKREKAKTKIVRFRQTFKILK